MSLSCMSHRSSIIGSLSILLVCGGCGDNRLPVMGRVTFNRQPVPEGVISFEPADGQGSTTGGRIVEGKYQLVGTAASLPGKKIVRISAGRKTGRKIPAGSLSSAGTMVDEIQRYIPPAYNTRSTLTCEVADHALKPDRF